MSAKRILSSITGQRNVNLSARLVLRLGFLRYPNGLRGAWHRRDDTDQTLDKR